MSALPQPTNEQVMNVYRDTIKEPDFAQKMHSLPLL